MSTNYYGNVRRLKDDHKLGNIYCNECKVIFNTYYDVPKKITHDMLVTLIGDTKREIAEAYDKIKLLEIKQMMCKTKEVKEEFDDEIMCEKERLNEEFGLWDKYYSCVQLLSKMICLACHSYDENAKEYGWTANGIEPDPNDKKDFKYLDESEIYLEIDKEM